MFTNEIENLFNPSYCGIVLSAIIQEYTKKYNTNLSFPFVYLILPLFFHEEMINSLPDNTKNNVYKWLINNKHIFIDYNKRIKSYVEITNRTIKFLIEKGIIVINEEATISVNNMKKIIEFVILDTELKCKIDKFKFINKWFFEDEIENIFYYMGVCL